MRTIGMMRLSVRYEEKVLLERNDWSIMNLTLSHYCRKEAQKSTQKAKAYGTQTRKQ
jgi:hypothetical protein